MKDQEASEREEEEAMMCVRLRSGQQLRIFSLSAYYFLIQSTICVDSTGIHVGNVLIVT